MLPFQRLVIRSQHVAKLRLCSYRLQPVKYNSSWSKRETNDFQSTAENSSDNQDLGIYDDLIKKAEDSSLDSYDSYKDIFKDVTIESDETPPELDEIFKGLNSESASEKQTLLEGDDALRYRDMDLDRTDENAMGARSTIDPGVFKKERALFDDVFDKYLQKLPKDGEKRSTSPHLWMIKEAMNNKATEINQHVSRAMRPSSGSRLSQDTIDKMFLQFEGALSPTFEYLSTFDSRGEYLEFLGQLFTRFNEAGNQSQGFFLTMGKGETMLNFTKRYTELSEQVKRHSEETPAVPLLNAYTLPLLFNHIIRQFSTRFYDGQLALTAFNLLKTDLGLYSVVCNQDTYNEVLKLHWVYYGKQSLYEIELTFAEMRNNGFLGNLTTFRILREIIGRYHAMKVGKNDSMVFWSREDDKKVKNLRNNLRTLAKQLKR
ncbi:hypothetical protein FT663_00466 [Candidozyma haemuli var. vulneris]|uniref:Mtf2-like C-terminal domain-containing protein n=1 Tax=Candidozyma haemuli TaxID=45357 RepID=A0A2V1ARK9_9ASCO|nr:hypothetical protein CXQ85_002269 [[Candida] haemuloni]KAF3993443.1 hypothetical protein FT662_00572 [[Candida] haemuloni var. vulneris]KAF3995413.1 hypothetical protein FT663_00466 [[Candida] haemuloni var. vulneris]PVH20478.1 hypothetical protein CXQ85_002269 [[Candida] haemuloni]